jgi:hypothetical protein
MATRKNRASRKNRKSTRKMEGGKRKASAWNTLVKRTFEEMRRKDRKASFGDALKEAARRKKRGDM